VLSYRALFRWFSPWTYLASKVLMPLAQMIFFTLIGSFGGSQSIQFFVIGNAMQIAAVSGIYGVTMSISGDRWDGTLAYLFGSPAGRLPLFFGRAIVHILDGAIGVALAFGWGVALFGLRLSLGAVGALIPVVLITVFSTSGMGLLMGCIGLITRNVMFVNNTVYFLLLFLSGANVPIDQLPPWLGAISAWLPLTHGIAAARLVEAGAGLGGEVARLIGAEALVGLGYLLVGYVLFSRFETRAKVKGTLETM
jgi:ABC-2 type transport system permease protein